jgi:hypothetical protein
MKTIKGITLILALLLLSSPLLVQLAHTIKVTQGAPVFYSVEPVATGTLTNKNSSINGLETPASPSPVGQNFTVEIHIRGADTTNEPGGISGIEVHFYFGNIKTYAIPVAYTDYLGTAGVGGVPGVLTGPQNKLLYGIPAGFYDAAGNSVDAPYTTSVYYKAAAASTSATNWNGANGLIAIVTFMIVKQPDATLGEPTANLPLALDFVDIVPPPPGGIGLTNGMLTIDAALPSPKPRPQLFVDPPSVIGTKVGDTFNVSVSIRGEDGAGVSTYWDVAGFDLNFTYDISVLGLLSYAPGHFLQQHGEAIYGFVDTTKPGQVEAVYTKLENPAASGGTIDTLITFTFNETANGPTFGYKTLLAIVKPDLASWAHPERSFPPWNNTIIAVDLPFDNASTIPWGFSTVDGTYTAPFFVAGGSIDLYDQYPAPYGGQGPNEHSDAFAPQADVLLYAKVTYGGDAVPGKQVTFEVHNAKGDKITILQNYTDANGVATVSFRIPQTDVNLGGKDSAIFGWWESIATVDLDGVPINDTMWYQVGWLVQVVSVTAMGAPYIKGNGNMNFTYAIQTISEQNRTALISIDAYDVQGYPIGEVSFTGTYSAKRVSGNPGNTTGGTYTGTISNGSVPTWARSGLAYVTGYALTDWPRNGGTPYGPQAPANTFQIKAKSS